MHCHAIALCDGDGGLFSRAVVHILNTCMNCNFNCAVVVVVVVVCI